MTSNKNPILLTIILPVLDAEEDINTLFKCLCDQVSIDKNEIEIIIVNDGSTDNTAETINANQELLKDFRRVNVIKHKTRQGLARTRLEGAEAASGKFITFIDKKARPDKDYLFNFINKGKNIVIGNVYVNKSRSLWGRALALVRKKIYYPYFNHPFDDIELDSAAYAKFKNKGGGGCMFVLRDYYLKVAKTMPSGVHVNDDSLFVQKLSKIEPVLKTASAKLEYMNRTGFVENILHLYNRGPKFVDFYAHPGRRFFFPIMALVVILLANIVVAFLQPHLLLYELLVLVILLVLLSVYLSEDIVDLLVLLLLLPIAAISFSAGVLKGLLLKLLRRY